MTEEKSLKRGSSLLLSAKKFDPFMEANKHKKL